MNDQVQQIKERLDIVEIVGGYVELHKAGRHFKGKSPFSSEKTPSFYVSPDRGMYYCFSTNQGGDMFTFIESMEGVDFRGALTILAEKAGIELTPIDPKVRDARDTQYALIEAATEFYFKQREQRPEIDTYLQTRGVEGVTVHTWRIGYAPDAWRALREHLTEKGFTDEQMLKAGLIKQAGGGKEPYDVFRDRVVFPIFDASGRVVAFSGRIFSKDSDAPKYVNSPETEFFQKSEILYGYDKARQGIRKLDFSLAVEGQFDVVLAHQAGYQNAVAVSGTAMTEHHVNLLQRLSNRSVLALDADRAGINAMKKAALVMLRKGMDVKVAVVPEGKDPADIIAEGGKEAFKKVIGSSKHVIEVLLDYMKAQTKDGRAYKLLVREELLPLVKVMPNRIDQEHFIGVIAAALEVSTDAITIELNRLSTVEPGESVADKEKQAPAAQQNRPTELYCYLRTAAAVLLAQEIEDLKTLGTKVIEQLDTLVDVPEEDPALVAMHSFTFEKHLEQTPQLQLREELSHAVIELKRRAARERLSVLRKDMSSTTDEAKQQELLEATKQAQEELTFEVSF